MLPGILLRMLRACWFCPRTLPLRRRVSPVSARTMALEQRVLPAGTVTTSLVNGLLTITGDAANNNIEVTIERDRVNIASSDTAIRGVTSVRPTALKINLGGDADTLTISGFSPGNLSRLLELASLDIFTGNGRDTVSIDGVRVRGMVNIDTGSGVDLVGIGQLHAGSVKVKTGSENDIVNFGSLESGDEVNPIVIRGDFTIDTGAGRDQVESWGKFDLRGATLIRTGAGDDFVDLTSFGYLEVSQIRNLKVETGEDMDVVKLSGLTIGTLNLQTGAAIDLVNLGAFDGNIQVLGTTTVNTGDANDKVYIGGLTTSFVVPGPVYNEFRGKVTINLGNGTDLLRADSSEFSRGADILLGQGRDVADLGRFLGGLMFDGPLLLDTGNNNDLITLGVPGVPPNEDPFILFGWVDFNGPVTIKGGNLPPVIHWHSDNASFNSRLTATGVKWVEHKINRTNLLTAPRITLTNRKTGSFREQKQRTFITNYTVTKDAKGNVKLVPVQTKITTGITLKTTATISADRRTVTVDIEFVKVSIDEPVATHTINTPLGPQKISLPVITTLEIKTRVTIPDGGTVLVAGVKKKVETRDGKIATASTSNIQLQVTPRIIIQDEEQAGSSDLQVTLDLRLIELIDRNFGPDGWDPAGEDF